MHALRGVGGAGGGGRVLEGDREARDVGRGAGEEGGKGGGRRGLEIPHPRTVP